MYSLLLPPDIKGLRYILALVLLLIRFLYMKKNVQLLLKKRRHGTNAGFGNVLWTSSLKRTTKWLFYTMHTIGKECEKLS